jgi:hypothetical protein
VDRRGAQGVLVGRYDARDHLEDLRVDERMTLKWIFKKWDREAWTELIWLRIWTGGGLVRMR